MWSELSKTLILISKALNSQMLTLSPSGFSSFGCTLEEAVISLDPIDYYYCNNGETSATTALHHDYCFPPHYLASPELPQQRPELEPVPAAHSSDNHRPKMTKKHNHNACERDRRKRINDLYSLLRSLLPLADQMKRLSIPATISRVLKYIPELQGQVEKLIEMKEQLSSKIISHQKRPQRQPKMQADATVRSSSTTISAANVNNGEIVVQISASLTENRSLLLSKVLLKLEEDGFGLINVSSTKSLGGRVLLSLHLQDMQPIEGTHRIWSEELSQRLLSSVDENG